MKKLILAGLSGLFLVACEQKPLIHDVAWYEVHDQERIAMMKICENNPGELRTDPNCLNAEHAVYKKMFSDGGKVPDLPTDYFNKQKN